MQKKTRALRINAHGIFGFTNETNKKKSFNCVRSVFFYLLLSASVCFLASLMCEWYSLFSLVLSFVGFHFHIISFRCHRCLLFFFLYILFNFFYIPNFFLVVWLFWIDGWCVLLNHLSILVILYNFHYDIIILFIRQRNSR